MDTFKGMQLVGPPPKASFVENIRNFGVFEPIIVFKTSDGYFKVGAGIRRITASRICEKKDIPAMVYEDEEDFRLSLTLIENNQRSSNPLAEVRAIMRLQKKKFSAAQIAEATGMPMQRIRERLRLNNLIKPLYNIMFAGKIAVTLGQEACKLPEPYQKKLLAVYDEKGKVKIADLKAVKNARQSDAIAAIPDGIFDPVTPITAPSEDPVNPALSDLERQLLEAYQRRRDVDGGQTPQPRVWDAAEFTRWDDEVIRLEDMIRSFQVVQEAVANV